MVTPVRIAGVLRHACALVNVRQNHVASDIDRSHATRAVCAIVNIRKRDPAAAISGTITARTTEATSKAQQSRLGGVRLPIFVTCPASEIHDVQGHFALPCARPNEYRGATCSVFLCRHANQMEETVNQRITLGLAMLASATLGAAAIQGLHAQAKPPVYAVVDISEIPDPEGFKAVTQRPAASTETVKQGGRYIARTDKITALDGTPPKRFIVIAFDSLEKAQAWNSSPGQAEINAIRAKTTKSRSFVVEGMSN
jgi:uncharacterized protein (DUF1330 family)